MSREPLFRGIYPAIVSPVDREGMLLEGALRSLVRYLLSKPVQGLYVGGGTGEGILLTVAIRKRILEVVLEETRVVGRGEPVCIIAHVGAAEAANTKELVLHAEAVGADAISAIPPIYYGYSRESVRQYYGWIAQLSSLPFIIYASAQSGFTFTADLLQDLLVFPTIKGLKYTGSNFFELMKMRSVVPSDFTIVNGADEQLIFGFLAGADGGIGTTYNIMPEAFCQLYAAWLAHDIPTMRAIQRKINAVVDVIINYPVIATIKMMLAHQGIEVGTTVFPNDPFPLEQKDQLFEKLAQIGWPEDFA